MKAYAIKGALALVAAAVAAVAAPSNAQKLDANGIGRTEALRHDFDAGREAIQVRVDFGPHASFPKHSHPGVEIAYVLERTMEYNLDGKEMVLKTGDALYIPAGAVHSSSVLLSLQADVAQAYFRLRALDAGLETVGRAVSLREQSVNVTQRRFELGDIGEFDLSRARTELASARIGVARAAMFPAVSLGAGGGGAAGAVGDVPSWSARSWSLGAALALPLLDGGRNRANVTRSEAALEESVGAYRQRVLVAFAEVEDNLSGPRILAEQSGQVEEAVRSAQRSTDLAQKLYDAGRVGYLELLDAQRNPAQVERSPVQLRGERALATVALVRALGGGWDCRRG